MRAITTVEEQALTAFELETAIKMAQEAETKAAELQRKYDELHELFSYVNTRYHECRDQRDEYYKILREIKPEAIDQEDAFYADQSLYVTARGEIKKGCEML